MENAYTVKELEKILSTPERTLRKRIADGQLQSCQSKYNPKSLHLIPESFIADFLAHNPQLPEVKKYKTEKARSFVNELRKPYGDKS
jgi:hypothetical protein